MPVSCRGGGDGGGEFVNSLREAAFSFARPALRCPSRCVGRGTKACLGNKCQRGFCPRTWRVTGIAGEIFDVGELMGAAIIREMLICRISAA